MTETAILERPEEDPSSVAEAVAAILDTPGPSELPSSLREVVVLRSAARRVLEGRLSADDEDLMLRNLATVAGRTEIPFMVLEAIEREILYDPPNPPGTWSYERRQRMLRDLYGDGGSCPCCFSRFASDLELERMERLRKQAVEEAERHEQAIERTTLP